MFTGIVEEIGEVIGVEQVPNAARLNITGALVTTDAKHGDSIAVNGVCLTVVDVSGSTFSVDVVHETLQRTSLAKVHIGDRVNLERAVAVGQRLGGHVTVRAAGHAVVIEKRQLIERLGEGQRQPTCGRNISKQHIRHCPAALSRSAGRSRSRSSVRTSPTSLNTRRAPWPTASSPISGFPFAPGTDSSVSSMCTGKSAGVSIR